MPSSDQLETPVAFWKLPRGRRRRFCSLQSGDGSLFDFVRDFKAKKKQEEMGGSCYFRLLSARFLRSSRRTYSLRR